MKEALLSKNAFYYDRVVYYARYFRLATRRGLATFEAQRQVFGRVLGDPNSVEVQAIMLVFLRDHFESSHQTRSLTKESRESLIRIGEAIGLALLTKYYGGSTRSVLNKLRALRTAASIIFLLITLGLVVLFALHLANKVQDVCNNSGGAAAKIALMVAIGVMALASTLLYLWETVRPRDFDPYKITDRSKAALLDKLSPHIMRNPDALYIFSLATVVLMACLCAAGEIVASKGGLKAELAVTITLAVLATTLLCIMAAGWCTSTIIPFSSRSRVPPELYECDVANLNGLPEYRGP
ncbi:hypothetical protein AS219_00470 [Neorickettsia sp. 179522]|nr:hypothetical protein AS219_00470 [Neorickettsia sp. 179522]